MTTMDILAEALHAHHPVVVHDPDDITTWAADDLDELALWDAAVRGLTVTDLPPDPVGPHGVNAHGDHEHTAVN